MTLARNILRRAATVLTFVSCAGTSVAHEGEHEAAGGLVLGQPPEYLHATGHSVLIAGLAISLLCQLAGWLAKNRAAQAIGLCLVLLCSAAAFPILSLGQEAFNRVGPITDEAGHRWLGEHMRRAETYVYAYYLTMAFAAGSLISLYKRHVAARALSLVTVLSGCVSLGFGSWISAAGGQIRHSEFRSPVESNSTNKPVLSVEPTHEHDH